MGSMGGSSSKTTSQPMPLTAEETALLKQYTDFVNAIIQKYPSMDVLDKYIQFNEGLMTQTQNLPDELKQLSQKYLAGYDSAIANLNYIQGEYDKTPGLYEKKTARVVSELNDQYKGWSEYQKTVTSGYQDTMGKLNNTSVNFGNTSLPVPALNTKNLYGNQMNQALTGKGNVSSARQANAQGYMDTVNNALAAKTNISGTMIPNLLQQRYVTEAAPTELKANSISTLSNLADKNYGALTSWQDFITGLRNTQEGSSITTTKNSSGSGWTSLIPSIGFSIPIGGK